MTRLANNLSGSAAFGSISVVLFAKKNKRRERFYLLPGQGGRNYHRKQQVIMRWTVAVALSFGAVLGAVLWWVSRQRPF